MKKIHGIQRIFLNYVLTLLTIAMALSAVGIGILLGKTVNQSTISQYTHVNDRIAVLLENEYDRTDTIMKHCLESQEIQDSLRSREPDNMERERLELMLSYVDLKSLETYLYVDNKQNLYLQAYRNTSYEKFCASGLKEALGDEYSKTCWIRTKDRVFDREGSYLFIGRYMRNMEFHHEPGMLFFQVNEGFFQNILKASAQEDAICMILDPSGQLCSRTHRDSFALSKKQKANLCAKMEEYQSKGISQARFHLQGVGAVIFQTAANSGFTAATLIPDSIFYAVAVRNLLILLGVYAVIAVMAVICSVYFSRRFTKPVTQISNAMKEFESGDFSSTLQLQTNTELDTIGNAFNNMVKNIEQLVQEVKENEQALRRSELSSLMYQINPHFLYNTLDTIYMLARINKEEVTMKMIQALSKFMKVSLSKGSDVIPVSDELEHIKSYMEIQKIRNNDLFQYEIECEEHLNEVPVLKLILQPLVENAIKHGFAKIYQDGRILIRVSQEGKELVFRIENNGEQMRQEVIELIQMMVKEDLSAIRCAFPGQESGYGIGNVISRLRLKYEDKIAFYYESDERGTSCTIRIPLQEACGSS
uniref:HAMP domain-containing protein n=1 Tax=Eubacterium plexicaudatum ASF492 TaxID=1235802 RepID=N2A8W6_9FIRM